HQLRIAMHANAANGLARRLRLGRHDRDLAPDEAVGQRRFPGVRRADDGDESAAPGHASRSSNCLAADCSATRFDPASARAGGWPFTVTSMVNIGAWAGPAVAMVV